MAAFDEKKGEELKGLLGGLGSDDGAPEAISGLVKGLGIRALTSCGVLEAMSDKLANDKTKEGKGAEAGCNLFGALVGALGVHFEPFGVPMLGQVIACYDHKAPTVREAAITAATSLVSSVNPNAVRLVLPALFGGMKAKGFREKCGALTLLAALSVHARGKVGMCLPVIVPELTDCLWDTKKETQKCAIDTLAECCTVVENPDIKVLIPTLISANARPEECPACIDRLMAVVFVQTVDAPTLSIIVPILARGLRNRDEQIKRKCCVVIDNMCKLVLDPLDAAPFGPKLLPELNRLDEWATQEVRSVGERARATLNSCLEHKPDH